MSHQRHPRTRITHGNGNDNDRITQEMGNKTTFHSEQFQWVFSRLLTQENQNAGVCETDCFVVVEPEPSTSKIEVSQSGKVMSTVF